MTAATNNKNVRTQEHQNTRMEADSLVRGNDKAGAEGSGLVQRIQQWARCNDWFRVDITTNQLRLEQAFGQAIENIAKDLDYQNQTKMRRQVYDCYDLLMAKCRQIDMVCRTGCRSEHEMLELEFLRSKAVAAATELAEVIGLMQRTEELKNLRTQEPTNTRIQGYKDTEKLIENREKLDSALLSRGQAPCGNGTCGDEWISFAQAAEILAVSKPTLSRWADDGKIQSNGKTGRLRKLNKISVLLQKQAAEDEEIKKDVRELRMDGKRLQIGE